EHTKNRLRKSWADSRLTVEWITPDLGQIGDLYTAEHLNLCTYLRLFMPRVLPISLRKVLYLDADLLVRHDIGELWDEDIGDATHMATQEMAAPYMDSGEVFAGSPARRQHIAELRPVRNFRELGIAGSEKYF